MKRSISRLGSIVASAGCLGQYIQELLEVGQEVLPLLPPDAKASLLAIARRQVSLQLRFVIAYHQQDTDYLVLLAEAVE